MSNAYLLLRNVNIIWLTTMWWISNPFTWLADVLLQWKLGWYGSVVIVKSVIVVVVFYIRCGNVHFELQTSWINIKIIRKQWRIWFNVGAQCLQRVLERRKEKTKEFNTFSFNSAYSSNLNTEDGLENWTIENIQQNLNIVLDRNDLLGSSIMVQTWLYLLKWLLKFTYVYEGKSNWLALILVEKHFLPSTRLIFYLHFRSLVLYLCQSFPTVRLQ